jgi:hypothetical protein
MSFEYSKMSLNATILTCRDIFRQPGAFLVARFLVCIVAHIPIADCRLYHTLAKGVLNNIFPFQMGPSASMVGRQPRNRHQKDPFVYRGSHPCLDRNPRYNRIAITTHLAVIPSFLPFCQQSSPCASVNVRRVHSGQSSLVLKQSSRD